MQEYPEYEELTYCGLGYLRTLADHYAERRENRDGVPFDAPSDSTGMTLSAATLTGHSSGTCITIGKWSSN